MKIILADKVDEYLKNRLQDAGMEVVDLSSKKNLLNTEIKDAVGLIVRSATKVTEELLNRAQSLRVIGRPGVGLDNIDLAACEKREITVYNSPEAPSQSVAEFTIGLIIDLARNISHAHYKLKNGEWAKKSSTGVELYAKTLGIIGTGGIGSIVAKVAINLGMKVLGFDVVENNELKIMERFEYTSLDYLYSNSDIITIHVPLIPPTKYLIDKDAFNKMKRGVFLINAARGGIVKEEDLLEALDEGIVEKAALDVFEVEPNIDERIRNHNKIIITPHIGASTKEAQFKNGKIIADKVINFLRQ